MDPINSKYCYSENFELNPFCTELKLSEFTLWAPNQCFFSNRTCALTIDLFSIKFEHDFFWYTIWSEVNKKLFITMLFTLNCCLSGQAEFHFYFCFREKVHFIVSKWLRGPISFKLFALFHNNSTNEHWVLRSPCFDILLKLFIFQGSFVILTLLHFQMAKWLKILWLIFSKWYSQWSHSAIADNF